MSRPQPYEIADFCNAAAAGKMYKVREYVEQYGAAIINERDGVKATAMTWAAYSGHIEILDYLLKNGANIESLGTDDRTALGWAVLNAQAAAMTFLLERGASLDAKDNMDRSVRDAIKASPHARVHHAFEMWERVGKQKQAAAEVEAARLRERENAARLETLKKHRPLKPSIKKTHPPRP